MKILATELQKFLDTLSEDWYIEEEILEPYYDMHGRLTSSDVINVRDGEIELLYQGKDFDFPGPEKDFMKDLRSGRRPRIR